MEPNKQGRKPTRKKVTLDQVNCPGTSAWCFCPVFQTDNWEGKQILQKPLAVRAAEMFTVLFFSLYTFSLGGSAHLNLDPTWKLALFWAGIRLEGLQSPLHPNSFCDSKLCQTGSFFWVLILCLNTISGSSKMEQIIYQLQTLSSRSIFTLLFHLLSQWKGNFPFSVSFLTCTELYNFTCSSVAEMKDRLVFISFTVTSLLAVIIQFNGVGLL